MLVSIIGVNMELLSQFNLNPYRIYKVSKKNNKGISTFPEKSASLYLDYTVDFGYKLQKEERILTGNVTITSGSGLEITSVVCNGPYLTAFIDGGESNSSYYLTYEAQTNLGGVFIQNMLLSIVGKEKGKIGKYSFLVFNQTTKPPDTRPPLNAIRINGRYLVSDSGFFMGV